MYDLIIIGMGMSGITAGIYAKRAGLDVLMFEKSAPGGILQKINKITNYPGFESVSGPDLAMHLFNQVRELNIPFKSEEVLEIKNDSIKKVITKNGTYEAHNVIIATGRTPKYLGLDNEQDYLGRGISTCATCDGFLYKGEAIAVVGSGNSALSESLYLANLASKVYLIHRGIEFKGDDKLINDVKNTSNIEIINGASVARITEKEGKISSVVLDNNQVIDVKGIFIYIGYRPDTDFIKNLEITNINGDIITDEECQTNLDGIFAIGDCRKKGVYQLVTAAADGAIAISNVEKKQKNNK